MPPEELAARYARGKFTRCTEATITDWRELQRELARVQTNGYAIDNQEHETGVECVAASIYGHKGVVAALSISGPAERIDVQIKKNGLAEAVKRAVSEISAEIGWGRGVDQIRKSTNASVISRKNGRKRTGGLDPVSASHRN